MPHSSRKFAVQDWVKCNDKCPIWKKFTGRRMIDHVDRGVRPEYWLKPKDSYDLAASFPFTAIELETADGKH
jgi:hypothetical protein